MVALPTGFAHSLLFGVTVVIAAHEIGHFWVARKAGFKPTIHVDGWIPHVRTQKPMTKSVYLAGPVASLCIGLVVFMGLLFGASVSGEMDTLFSAAGHETSLSNLFIGDNGDGAGPIVRALGLIPALAVADAVINMMTIPVLASVLGATFLVAGQFVIAISICLVGLMAAINGWRILDGDHFFALRTENANST